MVSWILTIDADNSEIDSITDRLWDLGTNGIATIPASDEATSQVLAGFEREGQAATARTILGGTVAPVDPTAWTTPEPAIIDICDRSLTIDAGHSFGHGRHPTTQLCIRALESHLRPGNTVLDVGCGSGVLALAAATLGAGSVSAIDIDPAAIAAARANATSNRIEVDITDTNIADLDRTFDVVVTNMLVADLEPIARHVLRVAGQLIIVSGALVEQRDRIRSAFPGASLVQANVDGDWAGDVYRTGGTT